MSAGNTFGPLATNTWVLFTIGGKDTSNSVVTGFSKGFMTADSASIYTRILFAVAFAWGASWIGLNMESLGFRIGQPNLAVDYGMGVLWWFVFAAAILWLARESRRMLLLAWVVKFVVVLILMLFYEQHYGLDSYTYFWLNQTGQHWLYPGVDFREDIIPVFRPVYITGTGQLLTESSDCCPSIGSENIVRFSLIVGSVTGPFYHAMKVAFAFMGLMGVWFFYRAVVVAMGRPYPAMFYLLAFFPSILFWSSTLGKDPFQFLFLGLYAYGASLWLVEGRFGAAPYLAIGLMGSYLMRPWITMIGATALVLATLLGRCRSWQVGLALVVATPLLLYVGDQAISLFLTGPVDVTVILEAMATTSRGYASVEATGAKGIDFSSSDAMVASWPLAFFSGLFRPLPFDINNPFTALAAVENTVVLFLAFVALFRFRLSYLRDSLVLWPLLFTVMWTSIHGFIVLVNFGSGVRYKLQMWPFFLLLLICITHKEGRKLLASRRAAWMNRSGSLRPVQVLRGHSPA